MQKQTRLVIVSELTKIQTLLHYYVFMRKTIPQGLMAFIKIAYSKPKAIQTWNLAWNEIQIAKVQRKGFLQKEHR